MLTYRDVPSPLLRRLLAHAIQHATFRSPRKATKTSFAITVELWLCARRQPLELHRSPRLRDLGQRRYPFSYRL